MHRNLFQTMALDKWTLIFSAVLLLVSSIIIGDIDAQSCGGNYTTDYGVFMLPNYPDAHNTLNVECVYKIIPSTRSSITLSFETFEQDKSSKDYVLISCESDSDYVPWKISWKANIPPISLPSCSIGRLHYISVSSQSYSKRGFRVQYQVSTEGCDKTVFINSSGNISSPNYPDYYNYDENCTYSIWSPEISSFTLIFQAFDLESDEDCEDWVQMRCDDASYISQKYCGSTLPEPTYINNCKKVLIWFHTDNSAVDNGFSLQYSVTLNSCESIHTADYGVFMSPNYPNVYYQKLECIYRIIPRAISSITLNFETFELDRSSADYITVSCESDSGYVPKKYTWSSYIPPISIPSCRIGRLYFRSDSYRPFLTRGFRVQYQVNTEGCGNTAFIEQNGTFSSPNYPKLYNSDENCTYSITAAETSTFTLSFQAFDLESDCQRDWVQIRCDDSSYILPKYCGSDLPKPASIRNCNKVLIWFHTEHFNVFSGFSLQYSVIPDGCGRSIYGSLSGIITSPGYPRAYNRRSCVYYLYTVSSVTLVFESFDLEPFVDKNYGDFVQIDLLFTNLSTVSRRYFGNALPTLISCTLCHRIQFFFNTNYAFSGTGFSIRYQTNPIVVNSAVTSSPKNLTVEVGSRVELTCTSDAFDYYPSWTLSRDGTDENTTVIASFCVVNFDYASVYYATRYGPGVCNLFIINATEAETGIYTCIDVGLASSSSVVKVVEPNSTPASSDQDDTVIVLSVLLAICILGYIGAAIFFIARRRQETSRDEGQRKTNQDMRPTDSVKPEASESDYVGFPVRRVFSPEYPAATGKYHEFRDHGLDNPAPYDTMKIQ